MSDLAYSSKLVEALQYLQSGKDKEAMTKLLAIGEDDPDYLSACLFIASSYDKNYYNLISQVDIEHYKEQVINNIAYFTQQAEKDSKLGKLQLGIIYLYGLGVEEDYSKARLLFEKAAKTGGSAFAKYFLAMCYLVNERREDNDLFKAQRLLQEAVDGGAILAQFSLSMLYFGNLDDYIQYIPVDYKKGLHLLEEAANAGVSKAGYFLGVFSLDLHNTGNVTKDYEKAKLWLEKSAAAGYNTAKTGLGLIYDKGLGVTKDVNEANFWYLQAAEQGDIEAQVHLGCNYLKDSQASPSQYDKAMLWLNKASQQGAAIAQLQLATLYCHDEPKLAKLYCHAEPNIPKDCRQAVSKYKQAAEDINRHIKVDGYDDKLIAEVARHELIRFATI